MIKTIELPFLNQLKQNLVRDNDFLQVILGPRQVGKTTTTLYFLDKNYRDKYLYVSADKVFNATDSWLRESWQKSQEGDRLLVIDEIQKIENWAETLKSLWDLDKKNKKRLKCIILGSSSLEIHRGLTESLTGRFQLIKAHHWNAEESRQGYGLSFDEFLVFGGYPASYGLISNIKEWRDYVKISILNTIIEKDIFLNNTVKSPALFKQAFEILISYPAQEISYTKLLGQLQDKGNIELIKYYISLYEGAFLIRSLEKFSSKKIKIKSSSPKILPLCPAFYSLEIGDEYNLEEKGRIFEVVVGSQLTRTGEDLFYWREGNNEVDFVLKKGKRIWAIEVKSGRKKSLKGIEVFKEKFPGSKSIFITLENYSKFEKDPMAFLEQFST